MLRSCCKRLLVCFDSLRSGASVGLRRHDGLQRVSPAEGFMSARQQFFVVGLTSTLDPGWWRRDGEGVCVGGGGSKSLPLIAKD